MWVLALQALVLLLACYFLGVWIGCIARRMMAPTKKSAGAGDPASATAMEPDQRVAAPAVTTATAAGAAAAAAAASVAIEQVAVAQQSSAAAAPSGPVSSSETSVSEGNEEPASQPISVPAPDPEPLSAAPALAETQVAEPEAPAPAAPGVHAPPPSPDAPASVEVTEPRPIERPPAFPADRLPAAGSDGGEGAATVVATIVPSGPDDDSEAASPTVDAAPDQDLTMIRGVDVATAAILAHEGAHRFEQIAAWNEGDVVRINRALGGMRRVQAENWIEQAKILADGNETAFVRVARTQSVTGRDGPKLAQPGTDQGAALKLDEIAAGQAIEDVAGDSGTSRVEPSNETVAGTRQVSSGPPPSSELEQVDGINAEIAMLLNDQGITRLTQLASLDDKQVKRLNHLLGINRRVQRERWIEQAKDLIGDTLVPADPAAPAGRGNSN
ncbi:MAG: helix-hairpin-helix domain-containing protein, partial [Hyphomicrobiaceae bacterium]